MFFKFVHKIQKLQIHRIACSLRIIRQMSSSNKSNMRFIQFQERNDGQKRVGVISEDGLSYTAFSSKYSDMIQLIEQNLSVDELRDMTQNSPLQKITSHIKLLPPVTNPEKIICIGLNYEGHCREQKKEPPKEPVFFSKFASAIIASGDYIKAHSITNKIDWEVELAIVIGKKASCVPKETAMDYIFGYCVAQDISARDWQKERNGGQFLIGKSMDTFCPLGPYITHKSLVPDPHNLNLSCKINDVVKQEGNSKELIFKIDDIIERLSKCITLKPGDVILTGTPAGVGMHRNPPEYLKPGDIVVSEIQSLGKIINKVSN